MLVLMLLVAVSLSGGGTSGSDCGPSTTQTTGAVRSLSAAVDSQRAEQSQRKHLEALFNRYGENGTISLAGLKRLLQNVGLDHIRTVMVQHHQQPGHHHNHHHRHHHHQGGHHLHEDHHNNSHPHKHADPSLHRKFPKTSEVSKDQDSHHNLHAKKSTAAQGVGITATYGAQLMARSDDANKRQDGSLGPPGPTGGETTRASAARLVTESQTPAAAVSRGGHGQDQDHDHGQDHGQDHVNQDLPHNSVECQNASSILSSHGMSQEGGVTLGDFGFLCPALLSQIDGGVCILHGGPAEHEGADHEHGHDHNISAHGERSAEESAKNIAIAWVGGFLSITVISLLSLLGVVLIPLMNTVFFKFLLSFLVALAVGSLSGDAFLHLIPHVSQGAAHFLFATGRRTSSRHQKVGSELKFCPDPRHEAC